MLPPAPPAEVRQAPVPANPELLALLQRPRSKSVVANGLRFAITEWGDPAAPLVLCLHGFPVSSATWSHLGPALARAGYRVVAPAMRGYYPTEIPANGDYGAATLGRDALALIEALGAEKAVLVGHDWGALAAMAAATLEPTRVSKLVTVAIPHPSATTPDFILKADHFLTYPWPGAATRFAADDLAGLEAIVHKWSPTWTPTPAELEDAKAAFRRPGGTEAVFGYYRGLIADGWRAVWGPSGVKLGRFAMPTLMVYGEADAAVDRRHFGQSQRYFTGAFRLAPIPDAGHFPQQESPVRFSEVVTEFVGAPGAAVSRP